MSHHGNLTLDQLADKDVLTVGDVLYLKAVWPEPNTNIAAANLATRVERAPQYCRFLTFERLNLLRLYKLQHEILTYGSRNTSSTAQFVANPSTKPPFSAGSSSKPQSMMSSQTDFAGQITTFPTGPSQYGPSSSVFHATPGMSSSLPVPEALLSPSSSQARSQMSSSLPRPMNLEELGIVNGQLDDGILKLVGDYNNEIRLFKEMQSWTRATSESNEIARSDFAFHFREERYILSHESMYDLSPRDAPSQADGIRKWLIEKLPLKYVNRAAYDLRRTRQDRGPKANTGALHWLGKMFFRHNDTTARMKRQQGESDDNVAGPDDDEAKKTLKRTATSASLRETGDIAPFVDDMARILVAVLAGLFLLIPMIVLSFIKSQGARLGTTVAFVIVFAIALGRFSKATNDALMGATAAYAAVLVVFVGQTTPIS